MKNKTEPRNSKCPLCKGTGRVTKRVANSRVTTRNAERFLVSARKASKAYRDRERAKKLQK